ncbi:MAG TPA: hypothetical protein VKU41_26120 [Polyangiaceae bacterium]|nr:hypothetical protein [Polyangiaceae bacterium]
MGRSRDDGGPERRVGQRLNAKWRVDRLIDVGGMGAVYVASHRNGRKAAIKLLHPRFANDPDVRKRFMREGYVANKIDHPGAVAILDDDVSEDGAPFLAMELLEGESLSAWLARAGGTLSAPEALAIGGQVLEVLAIVAGVDRALAFDPAARWQRCSRPCAAPTRRPGGGRSRPSAPSR